MLPVHRAGFFGHWAGLSPAVRQMASLGGLQAQIVIGRVGTAWALTQDPFGIIVLSY